MFLHVKAYCVKTRLNRYLSTNRWEMMGLSDKKPYNLVSQFIYGMPWKFKNAVRKAHCTKVAEQTDSPSVELAMAGIVCFCRESQCAQAACYNFCLHFLTYYVLYNSNFLCLLSTWNSVALN